jgi:DNA-binding MarR family transcriptional regulator
MSTDGGVRDVQTWYPQIYLACHVDHKRQRTTASRISPRDSSLLAHLNERIAVTPAELARHLRIGAPTLSAAIKRLVGLGYVSQEADTTDARRRQLRLTRQGARAMAEGSVLETSRVRALLKRLTVAERERALDGLALLARAARDLARRDSVGAGFSRPKSA